MDVFALFKSTAQQSHPADFTIHNPHLSEWMFEDEMIVECSSKQSISEENGKSFTVAVIRAEQNYYNKNYNLLTLHFQNLFKHMVLNTVHCKVLMCI